MARRRPARIASAIAISAAALGGCTTPPEKDEVPFVPPAWFAEQAQEQEEYRSGMQGCLAAKGWHVTVDLLGGIEEPFTADEVSRIDVDVDDCRVAMGYPIGDAPPARSEQLEVHYDKLVDVRDCLAAHGLAMEQVPSKDAWVDQELVMQAAMAADSEEPQVEQFPDFWHPYADEAFQSAPVQDQQELEGKCPQPWSTTW